MALRRRQAPLWLLAALMAAPAAQAEIKCWTNREGVRECGNVVPPEYVRQGHERISAGGLRVEEVEGAKSPEELAAAAAAREAEARRQELREAQAAEDRILLRTYTSAREIDLALEDKLAVLASRIHLTQGRLEKLRGNLELLRIKAANRERAGRPVPEDLHESIAAVERQIDKNQRYIEERRAEQEALRARYAAARERFEALKSNRIEVGDISHLDAPAP
jgi:chromosome segregation ATPase